MDNLCFSPFFFPPISLCASLQVVRDESFLDVNLRILSLSLCFFLFLASRKLEY